MAQEFGFGSAAGESLAGMIGSMEQMRKMWAGIGVPGSLAPTVDPGELERRIADLKVVEHWLEVNLQMLRGTIQAMEMQHGALAALHSIGASMASAMPAAAPPRPQSAPEPERAPEPRTDEASDWQATAQAAGEAEAPPPGGSVAAAGNPSAWWELLQAQFNQIAQAALGSAAAADNVASKGEPAEEPATKPRKAARGAGKRTKKPGRATGSARTAAAPKSGERNEASAPDSKRDDRVPPKGRKRAAK